MCRLLGVPRSSFYAWRRRVATETVTQARRRELSTHVAQVFTEGRGAYGCRRVAAQLNREGHACSVGLVADLMRELGLAGCQPRAYNRTTVPGEEPVDSPDLIDREFTAVAPGQRFVGDITYLKTGEGWLYLLVTWNHAPGWICGVGLQRVLGCAVELVDDRCAEVAGAGAARAGSGVAGNLGGSGAGAADDRCLCPGSGRVPRVVRASRG
ncbi:IS3 family transposase [Saccharopolyspora shandongensis]|uniref:IS3 family transposase n=1 Tax=Saccharopolyspora shandongensis TaxID=418495 RepID=UPI0033E6B306